MAAKKKQEIEFRYYEIPQNEPCIALLGEAWIRPYGMDSLHFHNYMEIGFCYDGNGEMVLDERVVRYKPDMFTVIPKNFPHNTASDNFSLSRWEYLFIDVEAFLREVYREDSLYADDLGAIINNRAWAVEASKYPEMTDLIKSIMDDGGTERRESVWQLFQVSDNFDICVTFGQLSGWLRIRDFP